MSFSRPEFLYAFYSLLVVVPILIFGFIRDRRALKLMGGAYNRHRLLSLHFIKWFFRSFFLILFITFTVFGLAGISWGEEPLETEVQSKDILFLLDISNSMNVQDIYPDRLKKSLQTILGVTRAVENARFGLTVFKGQPLQLIPLTEDTLLFENLVDRLDSSLITSPGTNIEKALETAIDTFTFSNQAYRCIVLLSDGEEQAGNSRRSIESLIDSEISLFALAAGTEIGGSIPIGLEEVIRDQNGQPVISDIEIENMQLLAERTGGEFFLLKESSILPELAATINQRYATINNQGFRLYLSERHSLFYLFAFGALILHILTGIVRWKNLL